jgi:putative ABC transport system permease protein
MESLFHDVRHALRAMRRNPVFTVIAVTCLALGIGANTAIFSLIDAVMLRPLPVRDPGQMVELLSQYPGEPRMNAFPWKYYEHFRDRNHVLSDLSGQSPARFAVNVDGRSTETVEGGTVLSNFFPMLGVDAEIGRLIGPQDEAVAVLGWSYWKRQFDSDPAISGKRIVVDDMPVTVIGVARRGFFGMDVGARQDLWVSLPPNSEAARELNLMLFGRLRLGVSLEQARAEMRTLDRARVDELVSANKDPLWNQLRLDVEPAGSGTARVRDLFGQPLLILTSIAGLLLLIACTNVGGMLLARGAARRQEMAVRASLGASGFRVVRQVLVEALMISFSGAAVGVVIAWWGADLLTRVVSGIRVLVPVSIQIQPDLRMLLFAVGTALFSGLLFGLLPALYAMRAGLGKVSKQQHRVFGNGLVVAQIGLSVVLLSGAVMFAGHLARLRGPALGFNRDSVLLVSLDPSRTGGSREETVPLHQLLDRLRAIPSVRSVTVAAGTPISGGGESRFVTVEGNAERTEDRRYVSFSRVGPDYFTTLEIPLVAGRDFRFEDQGGPRVAIVNQTMATRYFKESNPLRKHFKIDGITGDYEIVGVVGDAKYYEPGEVAPSTVYLNTFQDRRVAQNLVIRTAAGPMVVANDVRRVVSEVLKGVNIAKTTTLAAQVDDSIVRERLIAALSESFAVLGTLLTALGLYGLLAFTVGRRVHEIGIRMALGASRQTITNMVMKSALGLVCAGLFLGAPLAFGSRRIASGWLPNLSTDNAAFPILFAAVVLVGIALFAAYIPSRRAARVNPIEALRHD